MAARLGAGATSPIHVNTYVFNAQITFPSVHGRDRLLFTVWQRIRA